MAVIRTMLSVVALYQFVRIVAAVKVRGYQHAGEAPPGAHGFGNLARSASATFGWTKAVTSPP
jgi:hypothetical protein